MARLLKYTGDIDGDLQRVLTATITTGERVLVAVSAAVNSLREIPRTTRQIQ